MVQSKGTRPDSHLLRMDFTGSRKYSGRSPEVRRVGAIGEMEARRGIGSPADLAEERTGDIAHLDASQVFRFSFALSRTFVFCSPRMLTSRCAGEVCTVGDEERSSPHRPLGSRSGFTPAGPTI